MFFEVLTGFIAELRLAGVPVSMVESIDAMRAVEHVSLQDRSALKAALGSTLVKNVRDAEAFDVAFEVYFAYDRTHTVTEDEDLDAQTQEAPPPMSGSLQGMVGDALRAGDTDLLRALARLAVSRYAGMEPGRPVGGLYYVFRTLRALDLDALAADAMAEPGLTPLEERLLREEIDARLEEFRREVEAEVRRRLVADRGREAVAETLRRTPLLDRDLMHATRAELAAVEAAIRPLTRRLTARLARRQKLHSRGRLDFRKTMRSSLATGGVPVEPRFRRVRPSKPDVVLLCDISGSMATFARFMLQFVYAMSTQFSRIRAYAFVDGLDEVTAYFGPGVDFETALRRLGDEAQVVAFDGHSDYGHALERFWDVRSLTPKTTVIVTGDARTNYRDPRPEVLAGIAEEAKSVYWLNPEPRRFWNTGDSVIRVYEPYCREVVEVRTLRQLESFVEQVI